MWYLADSDVWSLFYGSCYRVFYHIFGDVVLASKKLVATLHIQSVMGLFGFIDDSAEIYQVSEARRAVKVKKMLYLSRFEFVNPFLLAPFENLVERFYHSRVKRYLPF